MNIIYINHYAGSPDMGMEFRPYYLAKEWIKMGHDVTIIAADYSHLRRKNPEVKKDFQREIIDGVRYLWVKTKKYSGNGVNRAFTMYEFVHKIKKRAKWLSEVLRPDIVITSSTYPLDTYAGQKIRKYSNAKLIHEVHDMWPITLIELSGMKKSNPFVVLMQLAENSFCKNSDCIVSLLPEAKDYFIKHGMQEEKFHIIMNGVVKKEWKNYEALPEEHKELLNKLHNEKKFVVCFFGSVTKSYAINYLIQAHKLLNYEKAAIVIVGEGNEKEKLKKIAGKDVHFLSRIQKKAIPSLLREIDCCYVGALHNDMFRFGICMNKLFDSMMSGKPILYAVEAPNNFVKDYNCGISVDAENTEALAMGLQKMISLSDSERDEMGGNGKNAVLNYFVYDKLAKDFERLFT